MGRTLFTGLDLTHDEAAQKLHLEAALLDLRLDDLENLRLGPQRQQRDKTG